MMTQWLCWAALVHLVKGVGPEAVADRFVWRNSIKTLVKEDRPGVAAMNNGGLSAAFKERVAMPLKLSNASALSKRSRTRTEGGQQPAAIKLCRCRAKRQRDRHRGAG